MARSPESVRLTEALAALNDKQREAAIHDGNVVVFAGPGSGKTRVLTVRAAHLLATSVPRRSALATITFTNAAADEMRARLGRLGLPQSRRVTIGTAHAFCLNEILLAHRELLPREIPGTVKILSEETARRVASEILSEHGIENNFDARAALTRARRSIAVDGTDLVGEPFRTVAEAYSQTLLDRGVLDFEEVVIRALEALRDPTILSLVTNRFTHLLVDEYQDMGVVLHSIVTMLNDAGTEVSAVGDPNQSVLGFTGASPAFLLELSERPGFETIKLDLNYRSAASLVAAAAGFVASTTPVQRNVREAEGVIRHVSVEGDQSAHASRAVALVQDQVLAGVPPGEIALLYPRKGPFLTALLVELKRQDVEYFHDRADVIPKGPLARWISRCALRSTKSDTPGAHLPIDITIPALARDLGRLSQNTTREFRRSRGRQLAEFFSLHCAPELTASDFTDALANALDIRGLIDALQDETDQEDFQKLLNLTDVPVYGLASSISPTAVTVTTYQSAKGREFDVVIMPGLVEGSVPRWAPTGPPTWKHEPPNQKSVAEERRGFYVAITRARNELYLITGSGWTNKGGFWQLQHEGPSRYVLELLGDTSNRPPSKF
ncbi:MULTISPECIES: ATP-dependent helicase [Corynebacterium]|uniref:ATP-dependent helicase n=1 Tax=Corynebacterium TaxID=1716 RepID=UPI00190C7161|nr:ATP-dependent helicase [Corynebacterium macginleyi]MBK4138934.1 UvrD-helicase domain-containing protein [Corynebacterium macginleyi]MBK4148289.1 UvrD-helicase domain-containing protein [Corynebacterium macginleyi]